MAQRRGGLYRTRSQSTQAGVTFWSPATLERSAAIEEELKILSGEHGPRFNQEPEKFRQPIIAYAYDKLVLNPQLSHYMFMRAVDPHTVYQEIRMYVDGVLGHSGRPIPDVDDKTLAEAKGFDKWSFRKKSAKRD